MFSPLLDRTAPLLCTFEHPQHAASLTFDSAVDHNKTSVVCYVSSASGICQDLLFSAACALSHRAFLVSRLI